MFDQDQDWKCSKKSLIYAHIERRSKMLCSRSLGSKLNTPNACSMIKIKRKIWKYGRENEKNMSFSNFCSKCIQFFSNELRYLPEVCVDSKFSSIMLEKCLVSLKNARYCLNIFSRHMHLACYKLCYFTLLQFMQMGYQVKIVFLNYFAICYIAYYGWVHLEIAWHVENNMHVEYKNHSWPKGKKYCQSLHFYTT